MSEFAVPPECELSDARQGPESRSLAKLARHREIAARIETSESVLPTKRDVLRAVDDHRG